MEYSLFRISSLFLYRFDEKNKAWLYFSRYPWFSFSFIIYARLVIKNEFRPCWEEPLSNHTWTMKRRAGCGRNGRYADHLRTIRGSFFNVTLLFKKNMCETTFQPWPDHLWFKSDSFEHSFEIHRKIISLWKSMIDWN